MQKTPLFVVLLFAAFGLKAQVFYECKSQNGDTTFYLFGTKHYWLRKIKLDTILISNYMKGCQVVFSELYIDDGAGNYRTELSKLNRFNRYDNNGFLRDSVSKTDYQQIYSYYHQYYGVSKQRFEWASYFRPLVMDLRLRYSDEAYVQMDDMLYKMARRLGKIVRNLDNEALLYKASAMLRIKYDIKWLVSKAKDSSNTMSVDEHIAQAYLKQDTASLLKYAGVDNEQKKILIEGRNRYWFTVLEKYGGRKNFIYCGIAHVITGPYALLQYFRNKHYSIKAIDMEFRDAGNE